MLKNTLIAFVLLIAVAAIPLNAAFIIEVKHPSKLKQKLEDENKLWKTLKTLDLFANIAKEVQSIDSIVRSEKTLQPYADSVPVTISVHPTGPGNYSCLYTLALSKTFPVLEVPEIIYRILPGKEIKHKNYDSRIIVATNITERIHYQEQMKLREQFFSSLIDSQTNFLIRIGMKGEYTFVNKQFSKTFGYEDNELIGKHFSITTIPEENHLCEEAFYYCISNKDKITKLLHKKPVKCGNLHDTEWEFIAITDEKGDVTEVQGIGQDVTERIKASEAILDQNKRLQSIASLSSHELRRPVANMLGLINIIDRDNFYNPENKEIIEQLLNVGNEIDTVINQIVETTFSYKDQL